MTYDIQVVVSSDNSQYLAWQTQVFCYSASTKLGITPTVVVHQSRGTLRPEFHLLRRIGCHVIEAPSFRMHPTGAYPPRNELGTLLTLADGNHLHHDLVLLCEPDMLFVHELPRLHALSGEYYDYLEYSATRIVDVAVAWGLPRSADRLNRDMRIGVPYMLPVKDAGRLARRWLAVLDSFPAVEWIDIMYAFGITLALEDLQPETTHFSQNNYNPDSPVSGHVVHYCYGNSVWGKRMFTRTSPLDREGSWPTAPPGSVLAEILTQIRQASLWLRSR
jgi:hypothetical protein